MKSDDWKYPNFPKNRGGFSGLGRVKAQTLDETDVPYLSKRPAPGVLALRKGDFLYVVGEQQPVTPVTLKFLTVGRSMLDPRTPNMRVWGADSITGAWTDRGPAPMIPDDLGGSQPSGGWRLRTSPPGPTFWELLYDNDYTYGAQHMSQVSAAHMPAQLHAYGQGRALFAAYRYTAYHSVNVFLSGLTSEVVRESFVTRDGTAFESKGTAGYARAAGNVATGNLKVDGLDVWNTPGTRYGDDAQFLFARGVIQFNGEREAVCLRDDGTTVTTHYIAPELSRQNVTMLGFFRIGAGWFVTFLGVWRNSNAEPTIEGQLVIKHSVDGGVTWTTIPEVDAPMFAPAYGAAGGGTGVNANLRFQGFSMYAVPLSGIKALILANMPTDGLAGGTAYNAVVLGVIDRTAGTITALRTLGSTNPATPVDGNRLASRAMAMRTIQPGPVAMGAGVALFLSRGQFVGEVGTDYYFEPSHVWFIERSNPAVMIDLGSMPFAPHLTGVPTATGPNTLVCPMYADGAYRVYQGTLQRDPITDALTGLVWEQRGIISADAPPPEQINGMDYYATASGVAQRFGDPVVHVLPEFTTLLPIRSDGNTTPAVPWASDSRIAAPE